ncbi:MAG: hypothetical protein M1605_04435 [Candidatus Thermoplasmatota archaeon]|nr:hypothetical protein [Candidatus Thermoplasmatota archaeon]
MYDNDAKTAKTLSVVAVALDALFSFSFLIMSVFVTSLISSLGKIYSGFPTSILPSILLAYAIVELFWMGMTLWLIYRPLKDDRVKDAETPSLFIGIGQLIFGGFITGIILLIAWIKIRDSLKFQQKYGNDEGFIEP